MKLFFIFKQLLAVPLSLQSCETPTVDAGGLDCPTERAYVTRDWRFAHYVYEGLQDPVSRFTRFLGSPFRKKDQADPKKDLPKNG
jgi:hypothetical protein